MASPAATSAVTPSPTPIGAVAPTLVPASLPPANGGPLTTIVWGGSVTGTSSVPGCRARDAVGDCMISMSSQVATNLCVRVPGAPDALRVVLGSSDMSIDLTVADTSGAPPDLTKLAVRLGLRPPLREVVVGLEDVTGLDVVDGGDRASVSVAATATNGDTLTALISCYGINP